MFYSNTKLARCQQCRFQAQARTRDAYCFFNLLTSPQLLSTVESLLPVHRERLFPPTEALSMFLTQVMSSDGSCQQAVNHAAVNRMMGGLPLCSTATGGYCKARQRLPIEMVAELVRYTGKQITAEVPQRWHWQGRPVRLVDGTTLTLPDTEANQRRYPQESNPQAGLGFPVCRLVGIICLSSGCVLNAAMGPYKGKGADEQTLLRGLLDTFKTGDMVVGDSYYCTYFLLASLLERGVDVLFEQYGARKRTTDFRRGKKLGGRDHLIQWSKPKKKPDWMTQAEYEATSEKLTVRELAVGGKILVTTLLSAQTTPKQALKALYKHRWHVEVDLRNIKTTLGMDTLSCKTPDMNEKEMWVYFLAYNLIRLVMAEAALLADILPRQFSFKHTLQLWMAWRQQSFDTDRTQPINQILILVAQRRVGNRLGRIEPRAVKRRLKRYPSLAKPRQQAREEIQKYGRPKKLM